MSRQTPDGEATTTRAAASLRKRTAQLIGLAFALVLAWGAYALHARNRPPSTAFPAIAMVRLDNAPLRIDEWLAGKPAVINVWATWCPPCRTEMPSLGRLSERLAPDNIRVLALSVDTDHNLAREFILKYKVALPVALASSPSEAMASLGAMALPLTLYVAADGRIVGKHLGQRDWADDAAVQEVRRHLGESPPARR